MVPFGRGSKASDDRRRALYALRLVVELVVIFGFAVGLRFAWAQYSPAAPQPPRFDDSVFYYHMAENIAAGHGYVHPATGLATAQWPPAYPFFLAMIFKVTGTSAGAAQAANALLGGAIAVGVAALTMMLTRRPVAATIAGMFFALSPSAIFIAAVLWSETLFTALFVAGLLVIALVPRAEGRRRWYALIALGTVAAAAGLTREAGLSLLPIAALFWMSGEASIRRVIAWTAASSCLAIALISPWTVRNYNVLGIPVLISSSSAGNFWQGHHDSTTAPPSRDLIREYGPLTRPGGEADVYEAMWREGRRYALSHPVEEISALLTKTRALYQGDPAGLDKNDQYGRLAFMPPARRARLIRIGDVAYYVLLACAGIGLFVGGLGSRLSRLGLVTTVVWIVGHVAFFVDPRFHLPVVPLFACLAGVGITGMMSFAGTGIRRLTGTLRPARRT